MHGTIKTIRQIVCWLFILSFFTGWILWGELKRKKENYTDLHRRVSRLEAICGEK